MTPPKNRSKYLVLLAIGIAIMIVVIIALLFGNTLNILVVDKGSNKSNEVSPLKITEIGVGNKTVATDVSPSSNRVYVADESGFIYVIDGSTDKILQEFKITGQPVGIAVSSAKDHDKIYVSTNNDESESKDIQSSNKIIVIDGSNKEITTPVNTTESPGIMDIDPKLRKLYLYVGNESDPANNHIIIMDTKNDKILPTNFRINNSVSSIAINPNKSKVYVADDSGHITIFDSKKDSVVKRIGVTESESINDLIVDPKTNKVYIAAADGKRLFVMDESYKISNVNGGYSDLGTILAIDPNTHRVYSVTEHKDDNTVSIVNTTTDALINTAKILPEDKEPTTAVVNPATNKLYISNEGPALHYASCPRCTIYYSPGTVVVIKDSNNKLTDISAQQINKIPGVSVGKAPIAVAVNPKTNLVYVANSGSDTVSIIDGTTDRVFKELPVREFPRAIAINLVTNKIYVANRNNASLSVIDGKTNTLSKTIDRVGSLPSDIAVDSNKNLVYVASDTVHVIDGSNDTESYEISRIRPYAISFDTNDFSEFGRLFVTELLPNIVSSTDTDKLDNNLIGFANLTLFNGTQDNPILLKHSMISNETLSADISVNDEIKNGVFHGNLIREDGSLNLKGKLNAYKQSKISDSLRKRYFLQGDLTNGTSTIFSNIHVCCDPRSIAFNKFNEKLYVANRGSGTVSVIDPHYVTENGLAGTVVANTVVGKSPYDITVNPNTNRIYVTNQYSDTVSVIYGSNDTVAATIPTANNPTGIDINPNTNLLYVANEDSNTVSIIDSTNNKAVVPENITINVSPFNSGHVLCNLKEFPTKQLHRLPFESNCSAEPNTGFQFVSWTKMLPGNSSSISTISTSANLLSPLNYFLSIFGYMPKDEHATLKVLKNGNYTANFSEIPSPVPPSYWASLFTVVATALVGSLLIPAMLGWYKSRKQSSTLNSYHQKMISLYKDGLDESDVGNLTELNQKISNEYALGKINNEQYAKLKKEISVLYEEIYKGEIDTIKESSGGADSSEILLERIYNDVKDAYSKDKISNEHYTNMKDAISIAFKKIFDRRINSAREQSKSTVGRAADLDEIREDITEAFSDNKITKMHYDLLNEKISKVTKKSDHDNHI